MIYLPDRKRTWTCTFRLTSDQSWLSLIPSLSCLLVISLSDLLSPKLQQFAASLCISLCPSHSQLLIQFRSCLCHFGLSLVPKKTKKKQKKSKENRICCLSANAFKLCPGRRRERRRSRRRRTSAETFGKIFIAIIYCSLEFIVYDTFQLLVAC